MVDDVRTSRRVATAESLVRAVIDHDAGAVGRLCAPGFRYTVAGLMVFDGPDAVSDLLHIHRGSCDMQLFTVTSHLDDGRILVLERTDHMIFHGGVLNSRCVAFFEFEDERVVRWTDYRENDRIRRAICCT